jgi:benzoate/toluate 1,2-dioxygenase beta subunit
MPHDVAPDEIVLPASAAGIGPALGPASEGERLEAQDFLFHEARLLDEDRFEEWLALFAPECFYWLPLSRDQENGLETVSLIFDDRRLLETRIKRVRHAWFHAQMPNSRLMHFVSTISVERAEGGLIARSMQLIAEHRVARLRQYHASVRHELRRRGDSFEIVVKRVDLIDSEGEHRGIAVLL